MALYKNSNGKLVEIGEQNIELEKHIQKLTEDNLKEVFGLEFVATEFEHNGLRIDTVAYDTSTNSFVVIEYKRDRSFSIVDQGYAYLSLILNNKAEFILLYNEQTGRMLTKSGVDWSQSRVLFVAQAFTVHQQQAINFRDMPIELWRVKMYDNDTILYDQFKPKSTNQSIKTISKNPEVQKVSSEVKVYEVADHFNGAKATSFDLYELFRDKIIQWEPNLHENSRKLYIGFSLKENGTDSLVYVFPQTNGLRFDIPRIRPENVNDPLGRLKYREKSLERRNTPESTIIAEDEEGIDYALSILKQVRKLSYKT